MHRMTDMFDPENYTLATHLFVRLLGLIYFFTFFGFCFQIKGLLGKWGILPAEEYLTLVRNYYKKNRFFAVPSLFWLDASDRALVGVAVLGSIGSILLVFGVFPAVLLPVLFFLYLSIFSVGQDFMSFGWETLLLELTYYAFLFSLTTLPNALVFASMTLFIFRFHFLAGWIKLKHGDATWKGCTALCYHFETQPIPNVQAWYAHKLPAWLHKVMTGGVFFFEMIVPFAVFGPEEVRLFAFFGLLALQFGIWFTGNFAFLNHMTCVMLVPLVGNTYLSHLVGPVPPIEGTPLLLELLLSFIGAWLVFLQLVRIYNEFFPNAYFTGVLRAVDRYFLAHQFAIFAHMTTKRYEIVIEASMDGKTWKEYGFWFKPSELTYRPRRVSPYQPRLDWVIWFLPFGSFGNYRWFHKFLQRLLEGSADVLALLRHNPFPHEPPRYVRAQAYLYEFSDFKARSERGEWWKRTYIGTYSPTLNLQSFR